MVTRRTFLLLTASGLVTACGGSDERPYLELVGGGMVFNYRIAQLTYGVVFRQVKALPEGSVLEASFDMPGGVKHVEVKPVRPGALQYSFESPPLKGTKKGETYTVTIRLLKNAGGEELVKLAKSFTLDVDQSTLPSKPLVVGPGYEPAPSD